MRVFVAGASGAIGSPLVRRLLADGHRVTGMTRSEERAADLRAAGADAAIVDVYEPEALRAAVVAAEPDVVVNELTDIPRAMNPRKYARMMAGLERIRTEGYRNLTSAAQTAGARRLVAQSISFMYAPAPGPATEDAPLWTDAPDPFGGTVGATAEGERTTLESGLEALVLRYGWFYGPGTVYAPGGSIAKLIKARRYPVVGSGDGVSSFIHVDDAAEATAAAVTSDATGVLNVVDDEPAALEEWLPAVAESMGARRPRRVPSWVARLAVGRFAVAFSEDQRGASNARAKQALGWAPAHPTWRGALGVSA